MSRVREGLKPSLLLHFQFRQPRHPLLKWVSVPTTQWDVEVLVSLPVLSSMLSSVLYPLIPFSDIPFCVYIQEKKKTIEVIFAKRE